MELSIVGRFILFVSMFVTMFPAVKSLCPSKYFISFFIKKELLSTFAFIFSLNDFNGYI